MVNFLSSLQSLDRRKTPPFHTERDGVLFVFKCRMYLPKRHSSDTIIRYELSNNFVIITVTIQLVL